MANNTISQVEVGGTTYDLLDANTLSAVSALNQRVTSLESSVSFNSVTNVRFDQLSSDRYGGIMFTGANSKYLVAFSTVGVVVMNQTGAIVHTIPWAT